MIPTLRFTLGRSSLLLLAIKNPDHKCLVCSGYRGGLADDEITSSIHSLIYQVNMCL
jgi:hypothetical protein